MAKRTQFQHSLLGTCILPVAQALRKQGLDAMQVIEDCGIDPAKAANADWRISHRDFNTLMSRCVAETGNEAFGLTAAEQLQPQVLHGLGLAWLASDTVYDGLKRLIRFGRLINTMDVLRLTEDEDLVHVDLGDTLDVANFEHASRDFGVGMVARMCRLTLGDFLSPVVVRLQRPPPAEPERWEYMLSSRVVFDCETTRLSWSRSDIEEPLITGDPALARANDEQTQAYLDSFSMQSTSRDVVDSIVQKLPDGAPSQQQIAESIYMSNRTLQRKLKEEGVTYKELLQDTRLQLARRYLGQPNRSVVEISYLLGFSEPSTFSRAFKRWTGMAPADYRLQAQ